MQPDPRTGPEKELIIFDKDGTLTDSKSVIDDEMAALLVQLLAKKKVAIISGSIYQIFETQILNRLPVGTLHLTNLYLLPTSGTRLYVWQGNWQEKYAENLSESDKKLILEKLKMALTMAKYEFPTKTNGKQSYGEIIEDRGSQITFSALGQNAPLKPKEAWDPTREKRQLIVSYLQDKLPRFDVRIGGTTSIDITIKGVNKAYGIRKLEDFLKIPTERIVFIGDTIFPGGNDYPAKSTGVDCIQVSGPEETKKVIMRLLS